MTHATKRDKLHCYIMLGGPGAEQVACQATFWQVEQVCSDALPLLLCTCGIHQPQQLIWVAVAFDQEPPPQLRSLRQNNHARLNKSGRGTRLAIRAIQMPETWCQVCVLNVMRCESGQSTERAPPRAACGVTGPQQGVALGVHMLHDLPQVGYLDGAPVPDDGEHLVGGITSLLSAPGHLPLDLHAVIFGVVLALISGVPVLPILEAPQDGCGE